MNNCLRLSRLGALRLSADGADAEGAIPQLQIVEFDHLAEERFAGLRASRRALFDRVLYKVMGTRCDAVKSDTLLGFPPLTDSTGK